MNNPVLKACYDMFSHSVEFTVVLQFWYSTWHMLWSWHNK